MSVKYAIGTYQDLSISYSLLFRGVRHVAYVHTLKQLHYDSKRKVKCRRESQAPAEKEAKYDGKRAGNFKILNKRK